MMSLRPGPGKAPVESGEIGYLVAGQGPPVASTHPYGMPRAGYPPIPGTTTITIWPRGFEKSSPARDRSDYGFWRLADDLDAVRRHLGLEKWVYWGTSMGGFTGLVYALKYQDTLLALILDSTAASHHYRDDPDSIWPELRASQESMNYYTNPTPENQAAFWRKISELMGNTDPAAEQATRAQMMEMPPDALVEIIRRIEEFDTRPQLAEIRIPTLVLAGEKDPQCPPSQARIIAAGIPGAILKVFPDTGHGVIRANPPGILELVKGFIDSALYQAR